MIVCPSISSSSQMSNRIHQISQGNCTLTMAIHVDRFIPLKQFRRQVDDLLRELKKVPTDSQTSEILYPGELAFGARTVRERRGIDIPVTTCRRVAALASELGLGKCYTEESGCDGES